MMSLRTRLFIFISMIVMAVLGISVGLIVFKKMNKANPGSDVVQNKNQINTLDNQQQRIADQEKISEYQINLQPSSEEVEKNAVAQFAKIFVERFATYSSQNNFSNITDVETLVTANLWEKLSKMIKKNQSQDEFISSITRVFSTKLVEWKGNQAIVELNVVQDHNTTGDFLSENKKAKIYLLKQGDNWLVNKYEWI